MLEFGPYIIKRAESPDEFTKIHQLNYETFVREIPQHHDTGSGLLVDKFHEKNTYLICLREDRLVGMLCYHDQPPFSAAARLSDVSVLEQPGMIIQEVRLMTVIPEERHTLVLPALVWELFQVARQNEATHFLISSIEQQRELHLHIGFELLGPDVGPPEARYAPMLATVDRVGETMGRTMKLWERRLERAKKNA